MQTLKLNSQQVYRLSEILGNLSLIFIASFIIPAFSTGSGFQLSSILSGMFLSSGSIVLSLVLIGGGKK